MRPSVSPRFAQGLRPWLQHRPIAAAARSATESARYPGWTTWPNHTQEPRTANRSEWQVTPIANTSSRSASPTWSSTCAARPGRRRPDALARRAGRVPPVRARGRRGHVHTHLPGEIRRLKDAYAAFDPDADPKPLAPAHRRTARRCDSTSSSTTFVHLMSRANYRRLTRDGHRRDHARARATGASTWTSPGTRSTSVEVFYRGKGLGKRDARGRGGSSGASTKWTSRRSRASWSSSSSARTSGSARTRTPAASSSSCSRTSRRWTSRCSCPAARIRMPRLDRLSSAARSPVRSATSAGSSARSRCSSLLGGFATGSSVALYTPLALDPRLRVQDVVQLPGLAADVHAATHAEPLLPEPRQQRRRDVPPARRGRGAGDARDAAGVLLPVAVRRRPRAGPRRNSTTTSNSTWRSGSERRSIFEIDDALSKLERAGWSSKSATATGRCRSTRRRRSSNAIWERYARTGPPELPTCGVMANGRCQPAGEQQS